MRILEEFFFFCLPEYEDPLDPERCTERRVETTHSGVVVSTLITPATVATSRFMLTLSPRGCCTKKTNSGFNSKNNNNKRLISHFALSHSNLFHHRLEPVVLVKVHKVAGGQSHHLRLPAGEQTRQALTSEFCVKGSTENRPQPNLLLQHFKTEPDHRIHLLAVGNLKTSSNHVQRIFRKKKFFQKKNTRTAAARQELPKKLGEESLTEHCNGCRATNHAGNRVDKRAE